MTGDHVYDAISRLFSIDNARRWRQRSVVQHEHVDTFITAIDARCQDAHAPVSICGSPVSYDANGNTLSYDSDGAGAGSPRSLAWDGENRPIAIIRNGNELLVSLALLSLMTIYTANAFNSLRSMSRVADEMSREYEIDAALRHVRGAIADTRPHFQPDGVGGQEFLFEGSAHTLTFVTAATGERERGGLYVVTLSLEENGELVERRRLLGNTTNHDGTRTVLLRRVGDLRFRYADSGTKDESTEFVEWAASGSLPQVIHVQITSDSEAQVASIHAVLRLAAP